MAKGSWVQITFVGGASKTYWSEDGLDKLEGHMADDLKWYRLPDGSIVNLDNVLILEEVVKRPEVPLDEHTYQHDPNRCIFCATHPESAARNVPHGT